MVDNLFENGPLTQLLLVQPEIELGSVSYAYNLYSTLLSDNHHPQVRVPMRGGRQITS